MPIIGRETVHKKESSHYPNCREAPPGVQPKSCVGGALLDRVGSRLLVTFALILPVGLLWKCDHCGQVWKLQKVIEHGETYKCWDRVN